MCRRTTCEQCGKPTWAGCGAHVEMVLGDVPKSERCHCHEQTSARTRTTKAAAGAPADDSALSRFKAWLRG
jgi:hypothetical protein